MDAIDKSNDEDMTDEEMLEVAKKLASGFGGE